MITGFISQIMDFLLNTIGAWGYLGIFILMAIESSVIPVPSELVLIPAGYLAFKGEMSAPIIFVVAVAGSVVGALVSYAVALHLGRRVTNHLVSRYGRFVFISPSGLQKAERYFENHGEITIFTSRLIPVVRHLISLPAGFCRMNIARFSTYTALGASIWAIVLIALGYIFGQNAGLIQANLGVLTLLLIAVCLAIVLIYVIVKLRKNMKINAKGGSQLVSERMVCSV